MKSCSIIKTNQSYGGDLALWTSRFLRKPFIARCGYMWSFNAAREYGYDSPEAAEASRVEEKLFLAADRVVVTTPAIRQNVVDRFPETLGRVSVIPNYVDTDLFRPMDGKKNQGTVLFVGRIAPEKNLEALLEAIIPLDARLVFIGEGKLRADLQRRFAELGDRVLWEGNVPNAEIPGYLNRADIFVLPSLYEGHPKVVLEAMACGVPVVGADSPGIRELIKHGETGLLCNPDPIGIRSALEQLLADPELRSRLGTKGRRYVTENYSLASIAEIEADLLRGLAERKSR